MEFGVFMPAQQRGYHQTSRQVVNNAVERTVTAEAAGSGARSSLSGRPGSTVMRALLYLVTATTLALQAGAARAQTTAESWPNRAITWVVPFAAGGVTDLVSRKIAELLRTRLGQPVVVENRPGAGGIIGTEFVARAQPDGYTVLFASGGPMTIQPNLGLAKLNYDSLKSYVHVRGVSSANQVLVATAAAPTARWLSSSPTRRPTRASSISAPPAPAPPSTSPARCSRRPPASS
jgi:hypothetical protein